jgi:preprotein translocase subunit SecD
MFCLSGLFFRAKSQISDAISGAIEKVRNRIDSFGVKETSIQIQGDNSILIQLPGVVDREIITKLREVGKLDFKLFPKIRKSLKQRLRALFRKDMNKGV